MIQMSLTGSGPGALKSREQKENLGAAIWSRLGATVSDPSHQRKSHFQIRGGSILGYILTHAMICEADSASQQGALPKAPPAFVWDAVLLSKRVDAVDSLTESHTVTWSWRPVVLDRKSVTSTERDLETVNHFSIKRNKRILFRLRSQKILQQINHPWNLILTSFIQEYVCSIVPL